MEENTPKSKTFIALTINISSEDFGRHILTAKRCIETAVDLVTRALPLPAMLAKQAVYDYRLSGKEITKKQLAYAVIAVGLAGAAAYWMLYHGNSPIEHSGSPSVQPESHHVELFTNCASLTANTSEIPVLRSDRLPNGTEMPNIARLVP